MPQYYIIIIIIIITRMYVCMYEYYPFSPHNDITIADVLILFSHLLIITFIFNGIIIIIIIIIIVIIIIM
jgi:hypothetical protein